MNKSIQIKPIIFIITIMCFSGCGKDSDPISISEAMSELKELEEIKMGAHHGVIIFSIMHILKTLPDIFEGLEYVGKDGEE